MYNRHWRLKTIANEFRGFSGADNSDLISRLWHINDELQ